MGKRVQYKKKKTDPTPPAQIRPPPEPGADNETRLDHNPDRDHARPNLIGRGAPHPVVEREPHTPRPLERHLSTCRRSWRRHRLRRCSHRWCKMSARGRICSARRRPGSAWRRPRSARPRAGGGEAATVGVLRSGRGWRRSGPRKATFSRKQK